MNRRTVQFIYAAGPACMPLAAAAHLLDGSPDPMPTWIPIAGLIIAGVMGGTIGFVINRHRQSMELKKKERQQRAAAGGSPAAESPPPESVP
jgi:ABC-type iron transport system FetAB permease component